MSITYSILSSHNLIIQHCVGKLLIEDLIENINILIAEPEFHNNLRVLNIYADDADITGINTDDLQPLKNYGPMFANHTTHVCVTTNDLIFGLWRMLGAQTTNANIYAVRTLEEACKILDIKPALMGIDPK